MIWLSLGVDQAMDQVIEHARKCRRIRRFQPGNLGEVSGWVGSFGTVSPDVLLKAHAFLLKRDVWEYAGLKS
jgi:hypothetical protein